MKERQHSIDILRFICACLVVLLHTEGPRHAALIPITRCAVPCFFMISGYLLYSEGGAERLKKGMRRIFSFFVWSSVLFAIQKELVSIHETGVPSVPSIKDWTMLLLFNENPFGEHLWYLTAYLYVLALMWFVEKHKFWQWMFYLTPALLIIDFVFGCYSVVLFGRGFYHIYLRNWLFVGIPCFAIGAWIKRHDAMCKRISKYLIAGGITLFSLSSIGVVFVLHAIEKMPIVELYPSSILLAVCLLLLAIRHNTKETKLAKLGRVDSVYIYILHPLVIWGCSTIFPFLGGGRDVFVPLLVLVVTLALIHSLRFIKLLR